MSEPWPGPRGDVWSRLDDLLRTDPADCGCDATREALDVYASVVVAGSDASTRFPGVAAHLAGCGQCRADLTGLVAYLVQDGTPDGR